MNSITITGNLTRDIEMRFLPDSSPVGSFSIADNQGKDKDAIFWNCSLFGKRAESLAQYLVKGQKVTVCGSVSQRKYNDKQTGAEKTVFEIRVNEIDPFCGGKPAEQAAPQQQRPAPQQAAAKPARNFEDFESDIPF